MNGPPREISWALAPDEQASQMQRIIESQVYENGQVRPEPTHVDDFRDPALQRQLVAAFEGQAWTWRRTPRSKAQHERGAVGLFRLEWSGADCGPLLRNGSSQLVIARYSRASLDGDKLIVPGIAIKLFRTTAPAVDLLLLPRTLRGGPFRDSWKDPFATSTEDPAQSTTLSEAQRDAARTVAEGLERVAAAAGADRSRVRPHAMPLPAPVKADRITLEHTPRASNLLATCGEDPFSSGDRLEANGQSLVDAMASVPWAHLKVDDQQQASAVLYLESHLHLGPVGDRWLHFSHPGR